MLNKYGSAGVLLMLPAVTCASVLSVDFTGAGTPMTSDEQAGVVRVANWNSLGGATQATPVVLKDQTGATTTATIKWTSNSAGIGSSLLTSTPDTPGDNRMMRGGVTVNTGTISFVITVPEEIANAGYSLYLYCDEEQSRSRLLEYGFKLSNAPSGSSASGNKYIYDAGDFSGAYLLSSGTSQWPLSEADRQASNYYVYTDLHLTELDLNFFSYRSLNAYYLGQLNGLQIVSNDFVVPAPEPAAASCLIAGALGALLIRRKA